MTTRISYYNLSIRLETHDSRLIDEIEGFIERYYTSKQKPFSGKANIVESKRYISKIKNYPIYYFHVNQFFHLYHYLKKKNIYLHVDEKYDYRDYEVEDANITVREKWKLRDYQEPIVNFLLENPSKSKLVPLATGKGKTLISLYATAKLRRRIGIIILPTYIDKWVNDIVNIHETKKEDIMVIQGSKALKALIELAKENQLDNNYYIFSSRTLQEFISQFEENPELIKEYYGIEPIELFPLLGIGVLINDEAHQHFHAIFRILLHTNVKYHIGLTATLMSDDYVIRRVHKIVYPEKAIYHDQLIEQYIDVYAISYGISQNVRKYIKTTNYGSNFYSHIVFEQSVTRKDFLREKYIKIIKDTIDTYYIEDYQEKDKLLIFVSTVNFASILVERLRFEYPHLVVNRYCEDDPYENLNADIIVSTIISSGTAIDIPNLRVVVQTVVISSPVSNIQSLGRLRKLNDRDVKFCYLYSQDIPKHVEYHRKREELFKSRVRCIKSYRARFALS